MTGSPHAAPAGRVPVPASPSARTPRPEAHTVEPRWPIPTWPGWQHFATAPPRPGMMADGDGLGRWLRRQQRDWNLLTEEQQEPLTKLGLKPAQPPTGTPARAGTADGKPSAALQRGITALAQYTAREGHHRIPRGHTEEITPTARPRRWW